MVSIQILFQFYLVKIDLKKDKFEKDNLEGDQEENIIEKSTKKDSKNQRFNLKNFYQIPKVRFFYDSVSENLKY